LKGILATLVISECGFEFSRMWRPRLQFFEKVGDIEVVAGSFELAGFHHEFFCLKVVEVAE